MRKTKPILLGALMGLWLTPVVHLLLWLLAGLTSIALGIVLVLVFRSLDNGSASNFAEAAGLLIAMAVGIVVMALAVDSPIASPLSLSFGWRMVVVLLPIVLAPLWGAVIGGVIGYSRGRDWFTRPYLIALAIGAIIHCLPLLFLALIAIQAALLLFPYLLLVGLISGWGCAYFTRR